MFLINSIASKTIELLDANISAAQIVNRLDPTVCKKLNIVKRMTYQHSIFSNKFSFPFAVFSEYKNTYCKAECTFLIINVYRFPRV